MPYDIVDDNAVTASPTLTTALSVRELSERVSRLPAALSTTSDEDSDENESVQASKYTPAPSSIQTAAPAPENTPDVYTPAVYTPAASLVPAPTASNGMHLSYDMRLLASVVHVQSVWRMRTVRRIFAQVGSSECSC
jgi:hypothetical protein